MPQVWYFTSKSGQIMIKKPESKKEESILSTFCGSANESDVVAIYIYPEKWNYKADEVSGEEA